VHTRRTSFVLVLAVLCVGVLGLSALAQSPAPQTPPPTFRSNVDLLTLEASVRGRRGTPVPDLQASDFTVTIDGRPRRVVSVQFFKADTASGARLTGGAPPTPRHVTNDEVMPGRVVVFAVDGDSIERGQEKALFETAARMLARAQRGWGNSRGPTRAKLQPQASAGGESPQATARAQRGWGNSRGPARAKLQPQASAGGESPQATARAQRGWGRSGAPTERSCSRK
jgi:hypothetical protein